RLCEKTCSFNNLEIQTNRVEGTAFGAAMKDKQALLNSSSGGIFYEAAKYMIENGGIVYGVEWRDYYQPAFIGVDQLEDLKKLQGSKYVQADTNGCYSQVRDNLQEGRLVLFSGTPCQIAGLYGFLKKNYENLYVIDIICHGVPDSKMLKADLDLKAKGENLVKKVSFRDKKKGGWGILGSLELNNGKILPYDMATSSYYYYFLKGHLYRDSCYNCEFAGEKRMGDLTIGDFWGSKEVYSDQFDVKAGFSCVLLNTNKGKELFSKMQSNLHFILADYDYIRSKNEQLVKHTELTPVRKQVLDLYQKEGWTGVDRFWKSTVGFQMKKLRLRRAISNLLHELGIRK
ncbi:MAG: Coenzyme F420 hydrogenase/dehydrogenase, beta subunit C-terminal domain, partial [Erysipelotrichaceae bacterium]|nr:Coenzyme F420 hydrogenase/dehydrogenase, beta subunit C-terminal domain [Erysipelotrichaceae bacterium]